MAGVQLLTAQGQALETGQHLPEEARFPTKWWTLEGAAEGSNSVEGGTMVA